MPGSPKPWRNNGGLPERIACHLIWIDFYCPNCKYEERIPLTDILETGAPLCPNTTYDPLNCNWLEAHDLVRIINTEETNGD